MSDAFKAAIEAACDAYYDDGGEWKNDADVTITSDLSPADQARQEHATAIRAFLAEAERQGWRMVPVALHADMAMAATAHMLCAYEDGGWDSATDVVEDYDLGEAWGAVVAAAPRITDDAE